MSLFRSLDAGASWEQFRQLGDPTLPGGYSSLAPLNATHVALAYEGEGCLQFASARVL